MLQGDTYQIFIFPSWGLRSPSRLWLWLLAVGDGNGTGLVRLGSRLLMSHLLFFIWSWAASDSIRIPNSEAGLFSVTAGTVNFVCQLGQLFGQVLIYTLLWRALCRSDCIFQNMRRAYLVSWGPYEKKTCCLQTVTPNSCLHFCCLATQISPLPVPTITWANSLKYLSIHLPTSTTGSISLGIHD